MEGDIRLLKQKILIYIEKEEYEKASKLKEWLDDIKEIKKNKKK
jgi:protein-arginine kinase activator protein McsA